MTQKYFFIIVFFFSLLNSEINAQEGKFELSGNVFEKINSIPIPDVVVVVYGTDGSYYNSKTDNSGHYSIKTMLSKNVAKYKITFEITGRLTEYEEIYPDTIQSDRLIFNFKMKPQKITVDRFFGHEWATFEFCSAKISYEFSRHLLDIVQILSENPDLVLEIKGFIDNDEFDKGCIKISKERSQQVCDFIISKGIDMARVKAIYLLNPEPVTIESIDEVFPRGSVLDKQFIDALKSDSEKKLAHLYNRRVEINVVDINNKSK